MTCEHEWEGIKSIHDSNRIINRWICTRCGKERRGTVRITGTPEHPSGTIDFIPEQK